METNTLHIRRAERRWTQMEAAAAAGLAYWTYRNIEVGVTEPKLGQIVALQRAFATPAAVLFPSLSPVEVRLGVPATLPPVHADTLE